MVDFTQELLLIDKPAGITSFDVIRRLRRLYRESHAGERAPKLGHAGTLDPLATGLLLIGVGPGTKRLAELTKLDKSYEAVIRLGEQRETGDLEGAVVASLPVTESLESLEPRVAAALAELCGTQELPVSAYSAIKQDGVPFYKRARAAAARGETITEVPRRVMQVMSAELRDITPLDQWVHVTVDFSVGSGTYIRSLAEALGARLGYPATLAGLRRTRIGPYQLADAVSLRDLSDQTSV